MTYDMLTQFTAHANP